MAVRCRLTPDLFAGTRWAPWLDQFRRVDCGVNTPAIGEYYMVHNEIWATAGLGRATACCVSPISRAGLVADVTTPATRSGARKIHALVDSEGLPMRVVVHFAAIEDRDGSGLILDKYTVGSLGLNRSGPIAATTHGKLKLR